MLSGLPTCIGTVPIGTVPNIDKSRFQEVGTGTSAGDIPMDTR
jgi:hypothetical protein